MGFHGGKRCHAIQSSFTIAQVKSFEDMYGVERGKGSRDGHMVVVVYGRRWRVDMVDMDRVGRTAKTHANDILVCSL